MVAVPAKEQMSEGVQHGTFFQLYYHVHVIQTTQVKPRTKGCVYFFNETLKHVNVLTDQGLLSEQIMDWSWQILKWLRETTLHMEMPNAT